MTRHRLDQWRATAGAWPFDVLALTLAVWALHVLLSYGRVGLSGLVPLRLIWPRVGSLTLVSLGLCLPFALILKRIHADRSPVALALAIASIALAGGLFGGAAVAGYAYLARDVALYSIRYQFASAAIYWMWIYLGWSLAVVVVLTRSRAAQTSDRYAAPVAQEDVEFWVRRNLHRERIRAAEVFRFEAAGDYVILHTASRAHMLHDSLRALMSVLDGREFMRVHRGAIVNLRAVTGVTRSRAGDYLLKLRDGSSVKVGRSYKGQVRSTLRLATGLSSDSFERLGEKPFPSR